MFRTVLVAYDDSDGARTALELALDLARGVAPVELVVVAVAAPLPRFGGTIDEVEEEQEFEHRRCTAWLEKAGSRATTRGTHVRLMQRSGHPAQELVRAAEELGSDLLVLGHSGHSAAWGRFLGSTTEKVSRHAPCSVLIAAPAEGRTHDSTST